MCGINGFTRRDESLIVTMNKIIKHRGPDGEGTYVDDDISLGHVRLAIIDPGQRSDQPMCDSTRQVVLVFNGEIYNFKALRHELSSFYKFITNSDTEVILAGYMKWGTEVFSRLNGIFGIAIWDTRTKELHLARGQRGVKPLYYFQTGNQLVFSSEIKAILQTGVPAKLNHDALQCYMRLRYVPGADTMFAGIKQVRPGDVVTFHNGVLSYKRAHYTSPFEQIGPTPTVRETIATAVARQVVSDKPVGIFLSGGVDSTIIAYEAIKHVTNLQSYSTWFEFDHQPYSDEYNRDAEVASRTATAFGLSHHMMRIKPEDVVTHFEKLVWQTDVPVPSLTMLSQYKISECAKHNVDVALGGDGGDEYFGGYDRYRYAYWMTYYQKLPHQLRTVAQKLAPKTKRLNLTDNIEVLASFGMEKEREIQSVFSPYKVNAAEQFLRSRVKYSGRNYHHLLAYFDQEFWLPDQSLIRSDKLSMAHGLEYRVPMLDFEIVAIANAVPDHQKYGFRQSKRILRDSYRDVLPLEVRTAPKSGWISPGSKWLRYPKVREFMLNILSPEYYVETAQLFDWNMVEKYYTDHCEGGGYHYNVLLSIATFQVWARAFQVKL